MPVKERVKESLPDVQLMPFPDGPPLPPLPPKRTATGEMDEAERPRVSIRRRRALSYAVLSVVLLIALFVLYIYR